MPTIKIKKGQWVSYCCHEDLTQADEDEEVEVDDGDILPAVFDTEEEGLRTIAEYWRKSGYPAEEKECLDMIKKTE